MAAVLSGHRVNSGFEVPIKKENLYPASGHGGVGLTGALGRGSRSCPHKLGQVTPRAWRNGRNWAGVQQLSQPFAISKRELPTSPDSLLPFLFRGKPQTGGASRRRFPGVKNGRWGSQGWEKRAAGCIMADL